MKTFCTTIAICLLGILTNTVHAQSAQASVLSNMTLNDAIEISAIGVNQNATFSTTEDYILGITNTNAAHLIVYATKAFKIDVKAASANFTGSSSIPASKLLVRSAGSGSYTGLSTTDLTLFNDDPQNHDLAQAAALEYDVDYYFNPGIAGYASGAYSLNVTYTATLL